MLPAYYLCRTVQAKSLSQEWAARADLPPHVVQLLNDFPSELHPMSQLSAAVTAMNSESHFAKGYSNGIKKSEFWEVIITFSIQVSLTALQLSLSS